MASLILASGNLTAADPSLSVLETAIPSGVEDRFKSSLFAYAEVRRSPLPGRTSLDRTRHPPIPAFLRAFDGQDCLSLRRTPGSPRDRRSLPAGTPSVPPRKQDTSLPFRAGIVPPRSVDESIDPRSRTRTRTGVGGS